VIRIINRLDLKWKKESDEENGVGFVFRGLEKEGL
jgi:hypothetical protein